MTATLTVEIWKLIVLAIGLFSVGMGIGHMIGVGLRKAVIDAHAIGINDRPTTPKPDITVKPQAGRRPQ